MCAHISVNALLTSFHFVDTVRVGNFTLSEVGYLHVAKSQPRWMFDESVIRQLDEHVVSVRERICALEAVNAPPCVSY